MAPPPGTPGRPPYRGQTVRPPRLDALLPVYASTARTAGCGGPTLDPPSSRRRNAASRHLRPWTPAAATVPEPRQTLVGSVGFSCSHGLSPPREPRCTPLTD